MDQIHIAIADLENSAHLEAIRTMTNAYAQDSNGLGRSLPEDVLENLPHEIASHPAAVVFLAWSEDRPVGIATCFIGFSTFAAKRLINIHDLAVVAEARGQRVGERLIAAVEAFAREQGYAKVTLEVHPSNPAKRLYERCGFEDAGEFRAKYLIDNPWVN